MTTKPYISVVITAYNRREFLGVAVGSCIAQSLPRDKFEIIIVKNFEDDLTDQLSRENGCIVLNNVEGTVGEQLKAGIKASSGEIICFLDDDDLYLPEKLDTVQHLFIENNRLIYYHNSSSLIDDNGSDIDGFFQPPPSSDLFLSGDKVSALRKSLKLRRDININSILTNLSCVSIRKSVVEDYVDKLQALIDGTDHFAFYASLAANGDMLISGKILNRYRIHGSTSNIFTPGSIKNMGEITIRNFLKPGHVTNFLSQALSGTNASDLVSCKLLEEKFVIRAQKGMIKYNVSIADMIHYIKCVTSTASLHRKTTIFRIAFIFGCMIIPSVVGYYYNLYRLKAYRKNVKLR